MNEALETLYALRLIAEIRKDKKMIERHNKEIESIKEAQNKMSFRK